VWAPEYKEFSKDARRLYEKERRSKHRSLFAALEEFANLRAGKKLWKDFRKHWPDFFPSWNYDEIEEPKPNAPYDEFDELRGERSIATIADHPEHVAMLWTDVTPDPILGMLLGIVTPPLQSEVETHEDAYYTTVAYIPAHWYVDWDDGALVYRGTCGFQDALYLLSRESWRAKVCAKCEYKFIAKRPAQKYCSTDCSELVQRELKLRWWAQNGADKRRKNSRVGKRRCTARRKLEHGPEETR